MNWQPTDDLWEAATRAVIEITWFLGKCVIAGFIFKLVLNI